jgi:hypothetical protein
MSISYSFRHIVAAMGALLMIAGQPVMAQVQQVDPNSALQSDVAPVPASEGSYGTDMSASPVVGDTPVTGPNDVAAEPGMSTDSGLPAADGTTAIPSTTAGPGTTYGQQDVLAAAEGVFGKGAEGLAKMVESVLKEQGEPNAYIAGREAGAALVVGLRYGSGTMTHKVEGTQPVYWTGPSIGFDTGANGSKTFVLVYNLWDAEDLFRRYPAAEGSAYVFGGFTASYLRRGSVVLIPIRLGVGLRLGVNAGYMKFTKTSRWMPF